MKKHVLFQLFLSIFMIFSSVAFALPIQFYPAINSGFVNGQFTCTEINQYGSVTYACGGHGSDGTIRGVSAKQEKDLPAIFLKPYHDPNRIHIKSVYISSFAGEIENSGEQEIYCQFPDKKLTKDRQECIILYNDGSCTISPVCYLH